MNPTKHVLLVIFCLTFLSRVAVAAPSEYWNLFNIEGESSVSAFYATYLTLGDMITDSNRLNTAFPDGEGGGVFAPNVVGSGSDGENYWNLFNIEGENSVSAFYATYLTLGDMITDSNRLNTAFPDGEGGGVFAPNVVGSGSDGENYWNLFNIEGESSVSAFYATYLTLGDMITDSNRLNTAFPDGEGGGVFAPNVVGSGAVVFDEMLIPKIPLPRTSWLLAVGLLAIILMDSGRVRLVS